MKKFVSYILVLLLVSLVVAALPTEGEEGIYDSVIRLHVIAATDSREDQDLKLSVRDEILMTYSAALSDAESIEAAEGDVIGLCGDIQKTAEDVVRAAGYSYTVKVDYGEEEYPTREYGEYTFPAGHYRSLRVTIGEGEGQNWWCVLFPPLCLDIATDTAPSDDALAVGLSPGEQAIITGGENGGYRVKLKTLELLEGVFSHRRK